MSKNSAEEVSMLMDDEVDEFSRVRIVNRLRDDAYMKSCWERYHLIGEALRNNLPDVINPDLPDRIANFLRNEPDHHTETPRSTTAARPRKAMTGMALAASLAVVAVVGLLQITRQDESPLQQVATTQDNTTLPSPNVELATTSQEQTVASLPVTRQPVTRQTVDFRIKQAETNRQVVDTTLYDYLMHHNEYTATMPVQAGMIPYARVVGYASDE